MGLDWNTLHGIGQDNNWAGLGLAGLGVFIRLPSSLLLPRLPVPSSALREGGVVGAAGGLALDRAVPPPSGAPGRARAGGGGGGAGQRRERERERERALHTRVPL